MPTISHMARVCRGAAGSILPHSRRKKERVESSLKVSSFYPLACDSSSLHFVSSSFDDPTSSFSFFLFFPSPAFFCFRSRNLFLRELPPRGSLLAEQVYQAHVVRLIHRHRSVGLGGPNTIDERMTPVCTDLARIGFSFSCCCCWIGKEIKRERYLPTSFIPIQVLSNRISLPGHQLKGAG